MPHTPKVSVIIPTLNRPTLVMRSLESVRRQTFSDIEIIVVVDGPDTATLATLKTVEDRRLQIVSNERSLTAAGARNHGASLARGAWIAFLDDDDEWMPNKLEAQLAFVDDHNRVLVSCRSQVRTPIATYTWPEVVYDNTMPVDEYLFVRRGAFAGGAYLQTSSFLLPRSLFQECPFPMGSEHDDWEFVLRLCKQFGAKIMVVPEALVILYAEEGRASLTRNGRFIDSLRWLDGAKSLLTRRGYSGFCLGVIGPRAADQRAFSAFFPLLSRAIAHGAPGPWQIGAYLVFWILPQDWRRRLRALFRSGRGDRQ